MKYISLINATDKRPRGKISVDEFSYTVTSQSGESSVTIPDGRTIGTDAFFRLDANGVRLSLGTHYILSDSTTIQAVSCDMFSDGKFPKNCVLGFELYTIS